MGMANVYKRIIVLFFIIILTCFSCEKNVEIIEEATTQEVETNEVIKTVDVEFSLGTPVVYNNTITEDTKKLKSEGREHSVKYYSYIADSSRNDDETFTYYDVGMNEHYMKIDETLKRNVYEWDDENGVLSRKPPKNCDISYGIDISKHNGEIDFEKVKKAGFDFAFIRIAYRGYGKAGNLKKDEKCETNLKNAKKAGLKIGAYVFSQATSEKEAIEEARFAIDILKDIDLDLPLVYDPETIKNDIARTDDVTGEQFTKNTIAFCNIVKEAGYVPSVYSNMVWQDYYFDMSKLQDYDIWYADYSAKPQTPYDFKYWQFSEVGIVDGVKGLVDLNVMITKK